MKALLLTLFSLLFLSLTAFAQGFVEEFRSEPDRRPPVDNLVSWAENAIQDLNGNGAPDMPFRVEIDGVAALVVYDGKTREKVWELPNASRFEEIKWYGFFKYYDKGDLHLQATHLVLASVTAGANPMDIFIIDAETGEIVWLMQNARVVTVADLDNDDQPELLVGDRDNRQVVMVGWDDGGSTTQSLNTSSSAWSAPAGAGYDLTLKFESEPDRVLAYNGALMADLDNLDANGDGVPEIVMRHEDEDGDPVGLVVQDGTTRDVRWRFEFPASGPVRDDILAGFHGFFDVNGDGQREALFGHRTAVTLDQTVHTLDADFELLAVHDLDGDGFADLVGRGVQNNTVQVWGRSESSTATEGEIEAALFHLFQNYPNPFREITSIAYEVKQSGPVTIAVYDVLGRHVRTLVDADQAPGAYQVTWNGRDEAGQPVASGQYVYRLRVGETLTSKQAIRVR